MGMTMTEQELANQATYLMFRKAINLAGYETDDGCIIAPQSQDCDDFHNEKHVVSIMPKTQEDEITKVSVEVKVDLLTKEWFLTADNGMFQMGRSWPITPAEGKPLKDMKLFLDLLMGN
jgi:hypothetical protein